MTPRADAAGAPPSPRAAAPDPPPEPPQKPLPMDCCESGCDRCVYDIYADEVSHYHAALDAWRIRNPGREPHAA